MRTRAVVAVEQNERVFGDVTSDAYRGLLRGQSAEPFEAVIDGVGIGKR